MLVLLKFKGEWLSAKHDYHSFLEEYTRLPQADQERWGQRKREDLHAKMLTATCANF